MFNITLNIEFTLVQISQHFHYDLAPNFQQELPALYPTTLLGLDK